MPYYDYMEDCIHLQACRRMSKKLKALGIRFTRGCNKDCTAYMDAETFANENGLFNSDQVMICINGACMDGKSGYYPGDLLISDYV